MVDLMGPFGNLKGYLNQAVVFDGLRQLKR